jgi:hypothetical protein
MDKLEPILKQKFWIILGVGLIVTITGWWMAAGSLAATITQRRETLDKVEGSIPSGELPNNDWSSKLSRINAQQEVMVSSVRRALWEQQKATYFWPLHVDEYALEAPYRSDFNLTARELYRTYYRSNAEEVWERVRPFKPLDGSGIVIFPFQKMPQKVFNPRLAPRSDEIWDAQEDLWLVAPILDAIREVNGGMNGTRLDAVVHVIDKLELLGGERNPADAGGAAGAFGGGGGGGYGMEGMDAAYAPDSGGEDGGIGYPMGGGGAGGGGQTKAAAADFDPAEVFGSSGRAMGGGGMGTPSMFGDAAFGAADGGGGGMPTATAVRRYVDDEEANLPYKTRAFYLSVIMDHRKVPHLIGELTAGGNSPWPMEILRVQIARLNPDDTEGRMLGAGGMMAGAGGYGGAPGYGGATSYGGEASEETYDEGTAYDPSALGVGGGYPGGNPAAMSGLSFQAALADPYVAKVALAGLIYIYKSVDEPPPETMAETTEEPVAEQPATTEEMPADPAAPAGDDVPAEAAPAEATPDTPVPVPADPAGEAATREEPPQPVDPAADQPAPAEPPN